MDPIWRTEGAQALALRWIAAEPGSFSFRFCNSNMARNWDEFRTALRRLSAPSSNLVYADVDGNIGYQAAGLLPIRRTYDGDLPANGSDRTSGMGRLHPVRRITERIQSALRHDRHCEPESIPADYKYRVGGEFAPHYRSQQIRSLLSKGERLQAGRHAGDSEGCLLRRCHTSLRSRRWRHSTSAARRTQSLISGADILRKWNGQMDKDEAAPLIATLMYQQLRRAVGDRASNGKGELVGHDHGRRRSSNAFCAIAPQSGSAITTNCSCDAFVDAMEEGRRLQGRDPRRWQYGITLETTLRHPIFGRADWIKIYSDARASTSASMSGLFR